MIARPRKPFPEMVAKLSDNKLLKLSVDLEGKLGIVGEEAKKRLDKPSAMATLAQKFGSER